MIDDGESLLEEKKPEIDRFCLTFCRLVERNRLERFGECWRSRTRGPWFLASGRGVREREREEALRTATGTLSLRLKPMVAEGRASARAEDDRLCERGSLEIGRWLEGHLGKSISYKEDCRSEGGRVLVAVAIIRV